MRSRTDAGLQAEADRRSQPAMPLLTLSDAVDWLHRAAFVPHEQIEGVVIDGEVYDLAEHDREVAARALEGAAADVDAEPLRTGSDWLRNRARRVRIGGRA